MPHTRLSGVPRSPLHSLHMGKLRYGECSLRDDSVPGPALSIKVNSLGLTTALCLGGRGGIHSPGAREEQNKAD